MSKDIAKAEQVKKPKVVIDEGHLIYNAPGAATVVKRLKEVIENDKSKYNNGK